MTAQESDTRLMVAHQFGERSTEAASKLFDKIDRRSTEHLPLFASDNWGAYKDALFNLYSLELKQKYSGEGRPLKPKRIPRPDLKYVQVIKKRKNRKIVRIDRRIIYGNEQEISDIIKNSSCNVINTSYIERQNLTFRNGISRLIRRSMNFSKEIRCFKAHMNLFIAWYNFVKPHNSLKIPKSITKTKTIHRTPAMAAGVAGRAGTPEEIINPIN